MMPIFEILRLNTMSHLPYITSLFVLYNMFPVDKSFSCSGSIFKINMHKCVDINYILLIITNFNYRRYIYNSRIIGLVRCQKKSSISVNYSSYSKQTGFTITHLRHSCSLKYTLSVTYKLQCNKL